MYRLNSKGQLAGWEALIIVILIGYAGYMTYMWAKKPSENSIYQAESKPKITDIHMGTFGCISGEAIKRLEEKNDIPIVNKNIG